MKPDSNRSVAIEDLLRLKRAERPPAEFWTQFDRQLRAKQLAALVAKRPWWQTLPRFAPLLSRYRLMLGASAVLAITFLSVRHYQDQDSTAATRRDPVADLPSVSAAHVANANAALSGASDPAVEASVVPVAVAQRDLAVPAVSATADAVAPGELSRMVSVSGTSSLEREAEPPLSSPRSIAANLAAVQFAEPVVTRNLLGPTHGFEGRMMPARVPVEPLQQMTPPSDTRRSRLLHAMVATASSDTSARSTERAASRIAEERLYDQNSRFDARGNGLKMKF